MTRSTYLVPFLAVFLFSTCAEPPTSPESSESLNTPHFKPKCDTPPCKDGDDPPAPRADQAILYSDAAGMSRHDPTLSIFKMNADGSNVARVFDDVAEYWSDNTLPAWAPDRDQLAFSRTVHVWEKNKLVSSTDQVAVGRIDGSDFTVIREFDSGSGSLYRPRWSPADVGTVGRVAWVENREAIVMARAGADTWEFERPLVADAERDERFGNMTWSRSGDQILVEGWYETPYEAFLKLYDIDCSSSCDATLASRLNLSPLSSNDGFGHVDWAHLHDWVLVRAIPAGESWGDLWLIDMTTGDLHPVTQTSIDVQDAVWSSCDDAILIVVWGQFGRRWSNKLIRLNLAGLPAVTPWDGSLDDPAIAEVIADVNPAGIDWRPPTPSTACGS